MDSGTQDPTRKSDRPLWRWGGFSAGQWAALAAMGGLILAIGATLALVLRAGGEQPADARPTVTADSGTRTPGVPRNAGPTVEGLYWPPNPLPLATPSASGDLLWWDARFAYRRAVRLDVIAAESPAGTWARVILDGERAQREGKVRADAADVRVLAWDGWRWWEIPRHVRPLPGTTGWELVFQLQGTQLAPSAESDKGYVYHVYYGHPFASSPPAIKDAPESPALLLELVEQEEVEWGPEVIWRAGALNVQTLASLDGRIIVQCYPGTLQADTRVRLRTVPLTERSGHGPLPDFELHADPPPGSPGPDNVVRWDPPLSVTINWAGLEVDPGYLESWAYFVYDTDEDLWRSVPVEFDLEHGVIRITTDQL